MTDRFIVYVFGLVYVGGREGESDCGQSDVMMCGPPGMNAAMSKVSWTEVSLFACSLSSEQFQSCWCVADSVLNPLMQKKFAHQVKNSGQHWSHMLHRTFDKQRQWMESIFKCSTLEFTVGSLSLVVHLMVCVD